MCNKQWPKNIQTSEVKYKNCNIWVSSFDYLILTGMCDLLLGYFCCGPFRWTDSASRLAHLVFFLYISVLWDLQMCRSIDRRLLTRYIALTSCPHHLLPHAVHSVSASRCIPTRRGEFGARTCRGWASKSWRFRHGVEMLVKLEWIQSSQFFSHSLGIPFELSNQIALVKYPKRCSTGVQIPGFPPYSTENELYRLGLTLPPSLSSLFLPVLLCLYSPNESRRVQVDEPDGERDGGGGGMRGKGLITTFPNGAASVPKCMRVRLGMTDRGTNGDKQPVPMYQRIPTHSLNHSLVLPS